MKNKEQIEEKYPHPRTMSEFIYHNVKNLIINSELKANEWINEVEISNNFSVSRTPVREAVRRLAAEGFVIVDSHKKARVKEITYDDVKEIYQVFSILDKASIGIALENISGQDIENLQELVLKMKKYCSFENIEKYLDCGDQFHKIIWKALPNKVLKELLFSLDEKRKRYSFVRIHAFRNSAVLERSLNEHVLMLKLIQKKDLKKLGLALTDHWVSVFESPTESSRIKELFKD